MRGKQINTLFPNMCFAKYLILATKILINDCLYQLGHYTYTLYRSTLGYFNYYGGGKKKVKLEVEWKLDANSDE